MTAVLSPLRVGRVTASRLPAVLGQSPFLTRDELMRLMVRESYGDPEEFAGNFITERGKDLEPRIISEYEMTRGSRVSASGDEQATVLHPRYGDWLAGTPDGCTADRVVECKAPWRARYTTLAERPDYETQVRLLMEVTGLRLADVAIYRPGVPLIVETIEHVDGWLDEVMPAIADFVAEFHQVLRDPELSQPHREPLRDTRTDVAWMEAAMDWRMADFQIKQLDVRRHAAADQLAALSPRKPARGGGVDLLRYFRRGPVQPKALGLNQQQLDATRPPGKNIVTVRRTETPERKS